jgi:hypothetical protein
MVEPDLELEARRLVVTVEDRGTAKALVLKSDDLTVEILSEPGAPTTAAGGYEELAREASAVAELLRARASAPPEPLFPEFSGERVT